MMALLAVTTDFLFSMAALMMSAATSVPPTSSATICTSGCVTTSRQFVVRSTFPSAAGISFDATPRLQTAVTFSRNPSFSAI